MKIDKNGEKLIKQFESCKLTAYKADKSEKYYTIGWGHYGADVKCNMTISRKKADEIFLKDIKYFEECVNSCVKVPITQSMFNALVSFTYNVGVGNLKKSSLLKYVNKCQFKKASREFKKWNKCGGKVLNGLVRRRKVEEIEFLREGLEPTAKVSNTFKIPSLKGFKGVSLVKGLEKGGYKSDFTYRAKIYKALGHNDVYKGTVKQNLLLLKKLKSIK